MLPQVNPWDVEADPDDPKNKDERKRKGHNVARAARVAAKEKIRQVCVGDSHLEIILLICSTRLNSMQHQRVTTQLKLFSDPR